MKKSLDANGLKLIAILAMTADHIAWLLFPGFSREPGAILLHLAGRITCPIMCYFIAEGYHHTRNIRRYTGRLFLFALLSHVPYRLNAMDYAGPASLIPFYGGAWLNQTSVLWALAWGLVMLRIADSTRIKREGVRILMILLSCLISFPSDWSCIAGLCVLAFGSNRGKFRVQMGWLVFYTALYAGVYCLALDPLYGLMQMGVVLAIPLLRLYSGRRGKNPSVNKVMKWVFYVYYPLHLTLLGLIRLQG